MRSQFPLLVSSLLATIHASTPSVAIVDVTVTQTIEVADFPTSATGLIYDTSSVVTMKPSNPGTPLAMPTSVFLTAPSTLNATTTTLAPGASKTAAVTGATPTTTKSAAAMSLDVRLERLWEGLLGVAIAVVVFG